MSTTETIEDATVIDKNVAGSEGDDQAGSPKEKSTAAKKPTTPEPSTKPDPDENGISWDFASNDFSDIVDQPTSESTASGSGPDSGEYEEPTEEEKMAHLAEEDESGKLSFEDLKLTSTLVIELIDAVNSTAVAAYAKEPAASFELTAQKKKTLVGILAKVFYRYQAKLGPIASLVIASLLYFGMTWKTGHDIRKVKKEDEAKTVLAEKKKKQSEAAESFRQRIVSSVGVELISLKEIGERMGKETKTLKRHIKILCDQGLLAADHKAGLVKYRVSEV